MTFKLQIIHSKHHAEFQNNPLKISLQNMLKYSLHVYYSSCGEMTGKEGEGDATRVLSWIQTRDIVVYG